MSLVLGQRPTLVCPRGGRNAVIAATPCCSGEAKNPTVRTPAVSTGRLRVVTIPLTFLHSATELCKPFTLTIQDKVTNSLYNPPILLSMHTFSVLPHYPVSLSQP